MLAIIIIACCSLHLQFKIRIFVLSYQSKPLALFAALYIYQHINQFFQHLNISSIILSISHRRNHRWCMDREAEF